MIRVVPGANVLEEEKYGLFVAVCGYELRSRFVPQRVHRAAHRKFATGFPTQHEHSFEANRRWFEGHDFDVRIEDDAAFRVSVERLCNGLDVLPVLVDISSMNRGRIAALIEIFEDVSAQRDVIVDWAYSPRAYRRPAATDSLIVESGPVSPRFAGWSASPQKPAVAIVGLGYEPERALGAVEYLDAAEAWAFVPFGEDPRFDEKVMTQNSAFWETHSSLAIRRYRVDEPIACIGDLDGLVSALLRDSRPIIIPLGPKMFSLAAMIVATWHDPEVTVWRVSGGTLEPATNAESNGKLISLRTVFEERSYSADLGAFPSRLVGTVERRLRLGDAAPTFLYSDD
jgi:hypothetical protein